MIKGVSFDLDGVFFTKRGMNSVKERLIQLSGNERLVIEVLFTGMPIKQFKAGGLTESEYLSYLNEKLGTNFSESEFKQFLVKDYEINTEVLSFMNRLREKNVKTLACSNNFPTRIDALNERFDFLRYFDTAVFSYHVHALKPSSEIFMALIEKAALAPEEIVYADDLAESLVHAAALGIKTHQFETFDAYRSWLLSFAPDLV